MGRGRAACLAFGLAFPVPSFAQKPTPDAVKPASGLSTPSLSTASVATAPSRETLLRTSANLARGYYQALIRGEFAQAAGFLHPSFLDEFFQKWLQQVQEAAPDVQKGKLSQMGLRDLSEASLLRRTQFFERYAKSPAGIGLRALSDPELQGLRPVIETQSCVPEQRSCLVQLRLKGQRQDGSAISSPQTLWVRYADGKYWVDTRRESVGDDKRP